MSNTCKATLDATNAIVVMVVDVVPEGGNSDHWKNGGAATGELIASVVKSPEFQQTVKAKINAFAQPLIKQTSSGPPSSGKTAKGDGEKNSQKTIKENPVIGAAIEGVQAAGLKMVTTCTAPGIFYNKHENKIIVIGSIVAIAGAFAAWSLRSDMLSSLIEGKSLENEFKEIEGVNIGSVKINARSVKFTPSTQSTESTVGVKWSKAWTQYITTDFGMNGTIKTDKAEWKASADSATAGVTLRLNDAMTISGGGAADFANNSRDMYLNFLMNRDDITIGLEYKGQKTNRPEFKHDILLLFKKNL